VFPAPFGFAGEACPERGEGWTDAVTGLQYLHARWHAPATGRFTQVDPFPGLLSLPGTHHPYAYALNNPLRYTDPSGEFVGALLGGLAIGAVAGGVSYALQHGGQPLASLLRDPNFWRAVAIGGVSGTVSGFVAGFFAPLWLLSSGVGTAMQIGGLIGMLSSFSSQVVINVLSGRPVAEGLGWAMLSGAVFGALGGALGYWAQQARPQPTSQPGTGNSSTPVDLHAFGGKTTGPRPPRVGRDLFPNASGMVGPERPPFPNGHRHLQTLVKLR
jgi:RHS repeat-associated protein